MDEFNTHGFQGTDTNRIARRAGFAPQTFYRWYKDKIDIFIACYRGWEDVERSSIGRLIGDNAPDEALVDTAVAHHRSHLLFRRSLRQLSLDNATVRQARAESRLRQIEQIRLWTGQPVAATERLATWLFELERLTDALAEGELADMGLGETETRAAIASILSELRRPASQA